MIRDLIQSALERKIKSDNEAESKKINTLRGGSTGLLKEDGKFHGTDPAVAYLRMKGISIEETTPNKQLMFDGGLMNEEIWYELLLASPWDGLIKREEEIPTHWFTDSLKPGVDSVPVTGRPDIVLADKDGNPVKGIELKQCMSVNSAYNKLIKLEPDLKHVAQAAHYSWQIGCPFELWYTNRVMFDLPEWCKYRDYPHPFATDRVTYRYFREGEYNPKTGRPKKMKSSEEEFKSGVSGCFAEPAKINTAQQGFILDIDQASGDVYYRDAMVDDSEWQKSIVNVNDIKRFYNYISELDDKSLVPPPAVNSKIDGKKLGWNLWDYSALGTLHPKFCQGMYLGVWVEKVKDLVSGDSK